MQWRHKNAELEQVKEAIKVGSITLNGSVFSIVDDVKFNKIQQINLELHKPTKTIQIPK